MKTLVVAGTALLSFFSLLGVIIVAQKFGFSPRSFHDPAMTFDPLTMVTAISVMVVPIVITLVSQTVVLREKVKNLLSSAFWIRSFFVGLGIGVMLKAVATLAAYFASANSSISTAVVPVGLTDYLPYLLWFLFPLILNSFSEELVYRAFPIRNLWQNSQTALVLIGLFWAIAFSLAHFFIEPVDLTRFLYRLSFGFFAALMFIRTQSLWKIVGLHTGWNLIALSVSDSDWRSGNMLNLTGLTDNYEGIANVTVLGLSSLMYLILLFRAKGSYPNREVLV